MKKYMAIVELDENRKTCIECPLCNCDDYCSLQDEDICFSYDSWEQQLTNCPLEEIKNQEELK